MPTSDDPAGRPGAVTLSAFAAGLMIAQQVGAKAVRDALFLGYHGAADLPKVMLAAAGVSLVAVLFASMGMQRWGPGRLVPAAFSASGALFAGEWLLLPMTPGVATWAIYLHMAVFGAIVISGFWSMVNERFDPHSAKKAVARIAAAATLGGLVGGVAAERVAAMLEPRAMLLVLAVLNTLCAAATWRVGAHSRAVARPGAAVEPGAGLRVLRTVPYLQKLGALVLLVAMTTALLDFALKAQASERFGNDRALMQFFAIFYTSTGLLTFVVQGLFGRRALSRLGLDGTVALLPLAVLITGGLATVVTRAWSVVAVKGVDAVLQNSLFRSGYELLYTPLAPRQKRPTKTIVDVAFDRVGDALGSAVVLVVLWLVVDSAITVTIGIATAAALAAWVVSRTLRRGYVGALAESLRSGAVELGDADALDATTRRTLSRTTMALDRERLLAQVAALRAREGHHDDRPPALPSRISLPSQPPPRPHAEEIVADVETLASGEPDRIREALAAPLDRRLTALVIPLLGDDELRDAALAALGTIAPRVTGQLIDALLDPDQPSVVRRRVAPLLGRCRSSRAAAGLFEGLRDERFEVRFHCAQALSRLVHEDESLAPARERVFDAAIRELEVGRRVWDTQRALQDEGDEGSHWLDQVLRARLHRGIEHVFTILSLTLERRTLLLSLQALHADDRALRGTALEYLENVLPAEVFRKLMPYLDQSARRPVAEKRSRAQIVDELLQSMDSLRFDRDAVSRAVEPKHARNSDDEAE